MPPYVVVEKAVGQTPLEALEEYRASAGLPKNVPMAYAGRLDPMASGKLLILIGDECKKQSKYHKLDKAYSFSVLFGTSSDSGDALGSLEWKKAPELDELTLKNVAKTLVGELTLPYPKFSSKTVNGKPLHVWTLEGRLDEIEIPLSTTTIHSLSLLSLNSVNAATIYEQTQARIESITPVTEESKQLGADFRRNEVRLSWQTWLEYHQGGQLPVATFECICSSGTYMRSLSEEIGRRVETEALALSINRDTIGHYRPLALGLGFWSKRF